MVSTFHIWNSMMSWFTSQHKPLRVPKNLKTITANCETRHSITQTSILVAWTWTYKEIALKQLIQSTYISLMHNSDTTQKCPFSRLLWKYIQKYFYAKERHIATFENGCVTRSVLQSRQFMIMKIDTNPVVLR